MRTGATEELLLGKDGAPVTTSIDGCGPVVVNADKRDISGRAIQRLTSRPLRLRFPAVAEIDRLGVLNDTWALGEAGEVPVTSYLNWRRPFRSTATR